MKDLVLFREKKVRQYPIIMRVVMGRNIHHFTKVVCFESPEPMFTMSLLRQIFRIRESWDWMPYPVRSWDKAKTSLGHKAQAADVDIELSSSGFFITVRPAYGEIEAIHMHYDLPPVELAMTA